MISKLSECEAAELGPSHAIRLFITFEILGGLVHEDPAITRARLIWPAQPCET